MNICQQLWSDETGAVTSAELVLIATIIVLGVIVGLSTFRDHLVQELGDASAAISALNHSYSFSAVTLTVDGENYISAGSAFEDQPDVCDTGDVSGSGAQCIDVAISPGEE